MKKFKRALALLLCTCMFITSVPVKGLADATVESKNSLVSYGDADSDKDVDMQDVLLMEKYVKGNEVEIDEVNADVNADGAVDETDVTLVKDYLVGNIATLTPKLCTITFDTQGGESIAPIKVGKGYSIKKDIPSAVKNDAVFTGWKKSDGSSFYKGDKVTEDITLVATYQDMDKKESVLHIDSYSITDQEPDISFNVVGDYTSIDEVKTNITLIPKDGKDPVEVRIEKNSDGSFSIGAVDGFTPGGAYALTLNEGLDFTDKETAIRTVNFTIIKEEKDEIYYSTDLIFIKDTEEMTYSIDGSLDMLDVLEVALLTTDGTDNTVRGTFNMSDNSLSVGDVVCIYENIDPRDRDYTQNDYEGDSVAYIRIAGVDGNTYTFENLSNDDMDEVFRMPDSIPFKVATLPTGQAGTVNKDDYDAATRVMLGLTDVPEYKNGDFIIFYDTEFEEMNENTKAVYAKVMGLDGDTVSYEVVTKEYVEDYMGMYVKQTVDAGKLLEEIDEEALLESIEKNAEESGFVEEAVPYLLQSAAASKEVMQSMKSIGFTDEEIDELKEGDKKEFDATPKYIVERKKIKAEIVEGSRYENSIKVQLYVDIVLSMNKQQRDESINSLKLEFYTGFEEEVAIDLNVDFEDRWKWYFCIPVLKELLCDVSVDINNFTGAQLNAQCYTIKTEDEEGLWELYQKAAEDEKTLEELKEIAILEAEAENENNSGNIYEANKIKKELEEKKKKLQELTSKDEIYSLEEIWNKLDRRNVSIIYSNGNSKSSKEAKIIVDELMNKYSSMVGKEQVWYELVNTKLFDKTFNISVVAIRLSANFIIKTNANLSICADVSYQVGKRYNYWFKLMARESGYGETDLVDETFGFKFHVMGGLELYATVKLSVDIGIISAEVASIGANVEFGPYLKLYGYFYYVFTNRRVSNTDEWYADEECLGALYFEFGLYAAARFKAQLLNDRYVYEKALYENEFPILTLGEKTEVYGFADAIDENATLYIRDVDNNSTNGITMQIPDAYRHMQTINLCTGENIPKLHKFSDFNISVTNRKFSADKNGVITVKPSKTDRYLEGELTITWVHSKYAFSKYDITVTIPVVWTNMTSEELTERFTASVAVGNKTDGYNIVWSKQYSRTDKFDLPTKAEILELIDYDSYTANGVNLKYSDVAGYTTASTGLSLTSDKVYYFDVTPREYTVTVNGIQNVDGSTSTKTYTARYGEEFNFSELESTGTNNPANSTYTKFYNLTSVSDDSLVMDMKQIVNREYFNKYGTDIQVNANYIENSLTATYSFVGIDAPDVEVKFQSGSIPYFEGINEYIEQYGGEGTIIKSISPAVEKINHTVKYTVICEAAIPSPKYDFVFDTQGGSNINSQKYTEGSVIFRPSDPTRRGYEFGGWYSDAGCQNVFSFDCKMPANNVTIYAKWIANTYEVTFISNDAELDTKTVTYDVAYGELPVPAKQDDFRFEGWYTNNNGGNLVTADTTFNELSDIVLYAKWVEKENIPTSAIVTITQTTTYNEKSQAFNVKLTGNYTNVDGFVVQYKKQGTSTWTSKAKNAGTYDVKITRATDDYYKKFDEYTVSGVFVINKASLSLGTVTAYKMGKNVRVNMPSGAKGDGAVTFYCGSSSNATGYFTNATTSTAPVSCYVAIAEGTNYKAATTTTTTATVLGSYQAGSYSANLEITFAGNVSVYSCALKPTYADGTTGSGCSLEHGSNNTTVKEYTIASNIEPWQFSGYTVTNNYSNAYHFVPTSLDIIKGSTTVKSINSPFAANSDKGNYVYLEHLGTYKTYTYSTSSFNRNVTSVGNFNSAGSDTIYLVNGGEYTFDYNGLISDQYYTSYNPFLRFSSPTFTVTSGNVEYDKFINYTGLTSFKIDVDAMKSYMNVNGNANVSYTVTLKLPNATVNGSTTYTKTITVNTAGREANGTSVLYSADSTYNRGVALDKTVIENSAKIDEYIEVPVSITKENNVWGALVNVTYNDEALELVGVDSKGEYTIDEFTVQENPTGKGFKFIVANDELENVTIVDEVVILKFKEKENAKPDKYKVQVDTVQAVSVDGNVQTIVFEGGNIDLSEPSENGNTDTSDESDNGDIEDEKDDNKDNTFDDDEAKSDIQEDENDILTAPDTVDDNNLIILGILLIVSILGIVVARRLKKIEE